MKVFRLKIKTFFMMLNAFITASFTTTHGSMVVGPRNTHTLGSVRNIGNASLSYTSKSLLGALIFSQKQLEAHE